jgi:hypothetical protein
MRTGAPVRAFDCFCLPLCEFVIIASTEFYPRAYVIDNFNLPVENINVDTCRGGAYSALVTVIGNFVPVEPA